MKSREELREKRKDIEIETEEGKDFLEKYDEPTRTTYKAQLRYFIAWRGKNCEELIDEAEEDWKKERREREFIAERYVNKFRKEMKEKFDYSSNTIANILTTLKAFYKFHQFPLNGDRLKDETRVNENHYKRISKDEIGKLYNSTTSKRNKAILLFLYQTGQAAKQLTDLTYGNVKEELEEGREPLMIEYSGRKGRGNDYVTFLGVDGIEALNQYLEERRSNLGREIKKSEPLFAKKDGVTRMTGSTIAEVLKYLARSSGLVDKDYDGRNPYSPHAFRKNFKSQLATKCSNFVIEYMMGHKIGVEKDYFLADHDGKKGLREYYARNMEPELSIQTTTTRKEAIISEEVEIAEEEKLREIAGDELEEEAKRWREKWTEERMERRTLEDEVEKLENKLNTFKDVIVGDLVRDIDTLVTGMDTPAPKINEKLSEEFDWYDADEEYVCSYKNPELPDEPENYEPDLNKLAELDLMQLKEIRDWLRSKR